MKVAVIGRGKLGRTLARALAAGGIERVLVRGHPLPRAVPPADVYVLAVPDARIAAMAAALAPRVDARAVALHCAGARDTAELAALRERGLAGGVFHPLVSFADARARGSLAGATFTLRGDARAVRAGKRLARALGAHTVVLGAGSAHESALYHAAAALVANGAAALAHEAVKVFLRLGFTRSEAERASAGLLRSVAANVENLGVPRALTGPVVRGDVATVARHLDALRRVDSDARAAYEGILPAIVATARSAGLDPNSARALRKLGRSQ